MKLKSYIYEHSSATQDGKAGHEHTCIYQDIFNNDTKAETSQKSNNRWTIR